MPASGKTARESKRRTLEMIAARDRRVVAYIESLKRRVK